MRVPARKRPNRIPLLSRELCLIADRQLLHPSVIDIGDRHDTLGALAFVADELIIFRDIIFL